MKDSNCSQCRNADSWGIPDRSFCKQCVRGSYWQPLNPDSVNPNKYKEGTSYYSILKDGWAKGFTKEQRKSELKLAGYYVDDHIIDTFDKCMEHNMLKFYENKEPMLIQVGWRVFHGEGRYSFVGYDDNEDYEDRWNAANGHKYKDLIEKVYIKVSK